MALLSGGGEDKAESVSCCTSVKTSCINRNEPKRYSIVIALFSLFMLTMPYQPVTSIMDNFPF